MPLVGFEPAIPVLKRSKTFHASDRAATVTGGIIVYKTDFISRFCSYLLIFIMLLRMLLLPTAYNRVFLYKLR
jgi:hypothetical protein